MKSMAAFASVLTLVATFNPSSVYAGTMQDEVNKAATVLEFVKEIPERPIPEKVFRDAKGLAILKIVKAGFLVSGYGGTGVVVARTGKGWSGPSAIRTGGAGIGLQVGAEVADLVITLNTDEAVKAFSRGRNVELGAGLSMAAGPVGSSVEAGVTPTAAVYTYGRSRGVFAGVSLEGTVIMTRSDANAEYYGWQVTPEQILSGNARPPSGAQELQEVLKFGSERTEVPGV